MGLSLTIVDAFTDTRFKGNPAAVCLLDAPADDRFMSDLAREMNLSETAFLVPRADGFGLRWFTPAVEVALCGHATIASAHVLWERGVLPRAETARFHTLSGLLTARSAGEWIELDFPAKAVEAVDAPPGLLEALNVTPKWVGRNQFDYFLELGSEDEVRKVAPDFPRLRTVKARGVIVTSPSASPTYDFVSRFFAPGSGIDEDPVTGSAHCALAPFWSTRFGKRQMVGYQASARGGVVRVTVEGDRVLLGGRAVTVLRGELA